MHAYKQQINSSDSKKFFLCFKGDYYNFYFVFLQNNKPLSQCTAKIKEAAKEIRNSQTKL